MNILQIQFKTKKAIVYGSFINLVIVFLILIVQTFTQFFLFSTVYVLLYGLISSLLSTFNARDVYQDIRLATTPILCPSCQQRGKEQIMVPDAYICPECGFKGTSSSK